MKKSTLITISIEKEDIEKLKFLKENGVNISFVCRKAIKETFSLVKQNKQQNDKNMSIL